MWFSDELGSSQKKYKSEELGNPISPHLSLTPLLWRYRPLSTTRMSTLPDFDNLPPVEGLPRGCAWRLFDKDREKDSLRTLYLLTPETVRKGAKEIRTGESVFLK